MNLFYNLGFSLFSAAVGIAATLNNKSRLMKAGQAQTFGILAEKVMCLGFDGAAQLYREYHQVDFASMGHTPCALFVTVSDIDRNLDPLTGLFISQAFMGLIREADRQPDGSLPVPVRFMLDDFANLQIPRSTTCSR